MRDVSDTNDVVINKLRSRYLNLPWYQKLLCPAGLRTTLLGYEKKDLKTAVLICDFLLNHPDFVEPWFHLGQLSHAMNKLNGTPLLTGGMFEANITAILLHDNPEEVAEALFTLNCLGLLSGERAKFHRDVIMSHQHPDSVAYAIDILNCAGLLSGPDVKANCDAILAHQNPKDVARVLKALHHAKLLTGDKAQANRDAVVSHQNLEGLSAALGLLNAAGLSTREEMQAEFTALMRAKDILCAPESIVFWRIIPVRALTVDHFYHMLEIATQHLSDPALGRAAIQCFVTEVIRGIDVACCAAEKYGAERDSTSRFFNPRLPVNTSICNPNDLDIAMEKTT